MEIGIVFGIIGIIGTIVTIVGFIYSIKVHCYQSYLIKLEVKQILVKMRILADFSCQYFQKFEIDNLHKIAVEFIDNFHKNEGKLKLFLDKEHIEKFNVLFFLFLDAENLLSNNSLYYKSYGQDLFTPYEMSVNNRYEKLVRLLESNKDELFEIDGKNIKSSIALYESILLGEGAEEEINSFVYKKERIYLEIMEMIWGYKNSKRIDIFFIRKQNIMEKILQFMKKMSEKSYKAYLDTIDIISKNHFNVIKDNNFSCRK